MFQPISLPDAEVFYDPDFLPTDQADELFAILQREIEWEQRSIRIFGREVPQPRLTAWYGDVGYTYSGLHWEAKEWPKILMLVKTAVEARSGEMFNSVLANLYRNGQDSVGWHSDDEPELGRNPGIASISLGFERTFHMKHKRQEDEWKMLLGHGSLLLMKGPTQHYWKHTLPKDIRVQEPRINLTFRRMLAA
jgi:alkylated DNA repair dioxygenase AlkB